MSTRAQNLTGANVKAGDSLPVLEVDVSATTVVLGALASRDYRPMHHDKDFAVNRNGTADIFMNTPNQAAWFERYLTDWTGPKGRLASMEFRMSSSVYPGDTMAFNGSVEKVESDDKGCCWIDVALKLSVGDRIATECAVQIAVPASEGDNPWTLRGSDWKR